MRRNNDPGSGRRMVARLAAGALGVLIGVCAAPARADAPFLDPVLTAIDRTLIDEAIAEAQTSGDVDVPVPKALLYKGLILFQGEDYTTAIPYLEEALRQDPTLVGAWEALGWAYWRTGQQEKTLRHFEALLRLMPEQAIAHNLMAQYAILTQEWEDADTRFRESLRLNPAQYEVRNWHAQNLLRLGQDQEALDILQQLIREDPGRIDIMIVVAQILFYERRYEEASAFWRQVLEEIPENVNALLSLARNQMVLGNVDEADALCVAALEIDPRSYPALILRADLADIADLAAVTIDRLEAVIEATSDPLMRARLRERLATRCHAMNKKHPGTVPSSVILAHLKRATEDAPHDVFILATYAEYCLVFKQYAEARAQAQQILTRFNRHHLRAKDIAFECAIGERRYGEAEQILHDRYAHYDPTDPMRHHQWARLEMMRGRYAEALKHLDKMEATAARGSVLTLLYHDLTESDWLAVTSVRRLYEHLFALKQSGFSFLSPTQLPEVLGPARDSTTAADGDGPGGAGDAADVARVPLPARIIDYLRYSLTGSRKFPPSETRRRQDEKWPRPVKEVVITFDDGLRNAFELGTPVAEDLGVPFGMFLITHRTDFQPSVASWTKVNEHVARGAWVIGSHLHDAHGDQPVSSDTNHLARALPNRIWLPGQNRIESMNEWDRRMRENFRGSLAILKDRLGDNASPVDMVAYPYGDIGQESQCNLSILRNPVKSILAEASRSYQVGFALNRSGYTCPGEDPMLIRRYEPAWFDEGGDVVRHAYENHPLFRARTLRIELAQAMGKPHLAEEMLAILQRDGYPETLLRRIHLANQTHFRNRPQRIETPLEASEPAGETAPTAAVQAPPEALYTTAGDGAPAKADVDGAGYTPSDLSLGAHLFHTQANDEFEASRAGVQGGLNLGRNTWLGAEASFSRIEQEAKTVWTIKLPGEENAAARTTRTVIQTDGTNSVGNADADNPWGDASPNFDLLPGAKARRQDVRLRLSHRFESGASLSASLGQARLRLDPHRQVGADGAALPDTPEVTYSEVIGDLTYSWYPSEKIGMSLYYSRDLLAVAYRLVSSDSVGFTSRLKISDAWLGAIRGQYALYDDDNAVYQFGADSFWEIYPAYGLWFGLQYAMASASDYSPYYWTPYWDERANAVLRYAESWQGRTFNIDFIFGRQREGQRTQDYNEWSVFYDEATDWSNAWGLGASFSQQFWQSWELTLDIRTMFLRSYADHSVYLGLDHTF